MPTVAAAHDQHWDEPAAAVQAVRGLVRASRALELACGQLNLAHYRVLAAVASGDERASRVAARLALGKPTVSAAVDALCQRGLLSRTAEVADQRAVALSLTEDGRTLLAQVERDMIVRLGELVARAPAPEQVLDGLAQLGDAIDAAHRERATARVVLS